MGNFNSSSSEVNSMGVLGAALSDGVMAGLIGGVVGAILPILTLLTGNSDMASLGFFVNILLYFAIGILAGYLYCSRKIGHKGVAAAAAVIGGLLAGSISGAVTGVALSRSAALSQVTANISWVTWGAFSALGAAFLAPLTAWIPSFFIPSDNGTKSYSKGTKQETIEGVFERRRKIRFVVSMVAILLIFAIYFCRGLSH